MPEDRLALSEILQTPPEEAEYDAICNTVMATARGRWFLQEYARRHHQADTARVLAAIERLQSAATGPAEAEVQHPESAARPHDVTTAAGRLRDMALRMRACGIEVKASEQIEELAQTILSAAALHDPANPRAQTLTEMLQYLEHRVGQMLDSHAPGGRSAPAVRGTLAQEAAQTEASAEAPTAMVEESSMGETPAEATVGSDAAPLAGPIEAAPHELAHAGAVEAAAVGPTFLPANAGDNVVMIDVETLLPITLADEPSAVSTPASPIEVDNPLKVSSTVPVATQVDQDLDALAPMVALDTDAQQPAAATTPMIRHMGGPLAALNAMSDEERIALFT